MIALVVEASRDVLEAPLCDEAEPSCRVAFALELLSLAVCHLLALALAKLAQHLDVYTVFPEFLFHYSRLKIYTQFFCSFFDFLHNLQASSAGDADIRTNGYQVLVRRKSFEINGCSMFAKGIIIGQVICWS